MGIVAPIGGRAMGFEVAFTLPLLQVLVVQSMNCRTLVANMYVPYRYLTTFHYKNLHYAFLLEFFDFGIAITHVAQQFGGVLA